VLSQFDLKGKLVTADALHTVKATAEFIREAGGEFVLPVKENRKALFDALDGLPWHQVPVAHPATDRGHGRITTRTIQVLPAPGDLPFPHVSQDLLTERYVSDLAGNLLSAVAAFGVASRAVDRASAAGLARHVREQWSIESLHWLRDTLDQEDKSQVRTRSGPKVMAALRNLAICALPVRTHRCHRSHPMGRAVHGPALRHARPHIMILKRPWTVGSPAQANRAGPSGVQQKSTATGADAGGPQETRMDRDLHRETQVDALSDRRAGAQGVCPTGLEGA
jgi:predicted transposase YbfD/YdcC